VILSPPAHQTLQPGATATFAALADATNATYQWLFDGQPISGATSATLTVTNAQFSNLGSYLVRIRNPNGRLVESGPVLLTFGSCPRLRLYDRITTHLEDACRSPTSLRTKVSPLAGTNPPSAGFGTYVRLAPYQSGTLDQAVLDNVDSPAVAVCSCIPEQSQNLFLVPTSNGVLHCTALVEADVPGSSRGTWLVVYDKGTTNAELRDDQMWQRPIARSINSNGPARLRFRAEAGSIYCLEVSPSKPCTSRTRVSLFYEHIPDATNCLELSTRLFTNQQGVVKIDVTSLARWSFDLWAATNLVETSSWHRVDSYPYPSCQEFLFRRPVTNNATWFYWGEFPTNGEPGFLPSRSLDPPPSP